MSLHCRGSAIFLTFLAVFFFAREATAQQPAPAASGARILLLPRRIVSGERATLAVLDVNGRLTPGVTVNFSNGDRLTTDVTGRALFVAPLNPGVIFGSIAGRTGRVATAILSASEAASASIEVSSTPRVASLTDRFEIFGKSFCGDADANQVTIAGQPAIVLASSPAALVVLPPSELQPGSAAVEVSCAKRHSSEFSATFVGLELEAALAPDTCYVCDVDSGKAMDPLMSFGGADKTYFSTGPNILGWGMAAAFGVKVARPDQPVVSVVGDGSFCFSGPQPLWSQARYRVPVMNIVLNNRSYNNERNRIWAFGGRQFKTGRDMTCYIGSPDVDYVKAAGAFGVEGEAVKEPGALKAAIGRAQRVIADGRPYLLDIHTQRDGIGAASTWHPVYSVADIRTRRV